jgi:pimeloyl-ACP methyl ester carboxylesterase
MGCTIALEYLARGGGRVARLVLMNGPLKLARTPEFPWSMSEEQLDTYLDGLAARWPEAEREFSRGAVLDPNSALADLYYQVALQTPLEMAMRIVREQLAIDHVPVIPQLQVPVLALYGRHDPYYPAELAQYIAERAQRGSYAIFEHSAHAPQFDEPDRFCQVIGDFVRQHGGDA